MHVYGQTILTSKEKYHCTHTYCFTCLDTATLLLSLNNNRFTCLVECKLVEQKLHRTVILTPHVGKIVLSVYSTDPHEDGFVNFNFAWEKLADREPKAAKQRESSKSFPLHRSTESNMGNQVAFTDHSESLKIADLKWKGTFWMLLRELIHEWSKLGHFM